MSGSVIDLIGAGGGIQSSQAWQIVAMHHAFLSYLSSRVPSEIIRQAGCLFHLHRFRLSFREGEGARTGHHQHVEDHSAVVPEVWPTDYAQKLKTRQLGLGESRIVII